MNGFQARPTAKLRLFCLPYGGGSASSFKGWSDVLPKRVEVCPVELPGHGSRLYEDLFRDLTVLVEALYEGLLPYLNKPYALFGHSMGALLCFEFARLLRRKQGLAPVHLFFSGCRAAHRSDSNPTRHTLSDTELLDLLRNLSGTPQEVLECPELLQLVLPVLRADLTIDETYQYYEEPPLDCPISVYGGLDDPEMGQRHLEAWQSQTSQQFLIKMFSGDHFFLHTVEESLLSELSRELSQYV